MWHHPNIDPVLFQWGPMKLHWYGLLYIIGTYAGTSAMRSRLFRLFKHPDIHSHVMLFIMVSIVLGGRLGYILFYNFSHYLHNPLQIFSFGKGGMSYHGAAIGLFFTSFLFSRHYRVSWWRFLDLIVMGGSVGVFFGRIGNFINQELVGRITDVPWGVVFPTIGPESRHPSQLYEAFGEGVFLYALLLFLDRRLSLRAGQLAGCYLMLYGTIRFFLEFFREPDAHIGFVVSFLSMGQLLCLVSIGLGLLTYIFRALRPQTQE